MAERDGMAERETRRAPRLAPPGAGQPRIWVLDDPRDGISAQALGIAERLGVPFRRVPLNWSWTAQLAELGRGWGRTLAGSVAGGGSEGARRGASLLRLVGSGARRLPWLPQAATAASGAGDPLGGRAGGAVLGGHPAGSLAGTVRPLLVLSSGGRSGAVALWLKARLGCRVVHCVTPGRLPRGLFGVAGMVRRRDEYDLLVVPEHDRALAAHNVLPVLGAPHRIGPQTLSQAAEQWGERLDHLPHPRVALLVGGPVRGSDMEPARAHALARSVARLVGGLGGSVLASTSRRTGREASDALAAGLGQVMHLLYRWGEPGENPYLGFLAAADAIIVTADSVSMLSEACSTAVPVYAALPELCGARHRRFLARLAEAGQVRPLRSDVSPWPRTPLDEAGRVAAEILRRFPVE